MLSLDSSEWTKLDHAYGKAGDIPELLRALNKHSESKTYKTEPYFSLWSSLCHQGDTYSASIAAVPHLLKICDEFPETVEWSVIQLAMCIEISRLEGRCSKDISGDGYKLNIAKLPEITNSIRKSQPCQEIEILHRVAVLISKGDFNTANKILEED